VKPFDFCPGCGARLRHPDDDGALLCPSCGRTWFRNMAPTAGAALVADGRALVTVRGVEPAKGRLDVPGGFLGPEEGPIEALRREVDEELGITIDVSFDDLVQAVPHLYGPPGEEIVVLALGFTPRWVAGEPRAADDVADIVWLTEDELEDADFAWDHDRELVRKGLERG
jgi:ADP-ribose pyrophosphatase YjhB (NUDIX family)